jgi:hypothetical protein
MRKYSNNWVFIDLLFNLLVGFTSLFVLAFMLINPIAKKGTIEPPVVFMIESSWADDSSADIDLYLRGPNGNLIYFGNKDGSYMYLDRDDLGKSNDTFTINGEQVVIQRNYEMITVSQLLPGEYVINLHYFSMMGEVETVDVRATNISPFNVVVDRQIELLPRQEKTVASFYVEPDGTITDIRTDLNIRLRIPK